MAARIWLDGELVDAAAAHLRITDRGFQLGDGIFETARARRGVVIELDEHLGRLRQSAAALAIRLPYDDRAFVDGIGALLAVEGLAGSGSDDTAPGDAALRITVSRGPLERRGLLPAGFEDIVPTIAIQAWPYVSPGAEVLERGVRAITSTIRRDPGSPMAGIKSTSRADYVYAKLEAVRAGVDDALFLTTDGAISEGTTANVWAVERTDPGHAAARRRGPSRHDPDVAPGPCSSAGSRTGRGGSPGGSSARVRRGLPVFERGRSRAPGRPRRPTRRERPAGTLDDRPARCPRSGHRHPQPGRALTRTELIERTSRLVAEGERLTANPSLQGLQVWLQLSDELLSAAWGTMDRYHLSWLMVGKPKTTVRGRPMTHAEEVAYVREVAEQKTAALRMSLDAVERRMPFVGEDIGGSGDGGDGG